MPTNLTSLLATIIITVISSATMTAVIQGLFQRKRQTAESGKIEVEAGVVVFETLKDLIIPLREQIARMVEENLECEERNKLLTDRLDKLEERYAEAERKLRLES